MLKTIAILIAALAVLAGGLFFVASRVTPGAKTEPKKIGPAMERPYAPQPIPRADTPPARVARPAPAPVPAAPAPPTATAPASPAPSAPAPTVAAPQAADAAAPEAPATAAAPDSAAPRYPKGYAGCDHYKSYDPTTQTFKTREGRVMPCRVQ
ncbi:BA14K family protein [Alsobacter soli]|uniref:BA14K family protein n=1 Tax=Alsobacter soli TaxID=2109933 RepID=UPI001304CDEE|nr:BA14K family protein [Alsobacter soli]